jgi:hypothetical protein
VKFALGTVTVTHLPPVEELESGAQVMPLLHLRIPVSAYNPFLSMESTNKHSLSRVFLETARTVLDRVSSSYAMLALAERTWHGVIVATRAIAPDTETTVAAGNVKSMLSSISK